MSGLTHETLISPRESTYFIVALILAILIWLPLTLVTLGFVWLGIGFMGIVFWFTNGLLVASLRAEAVLIHKQQNPRLYNAFQDVCAKLHLPEVPELYVIQSGGALNAFATRHSGRHFVVIYSEMLEALGPDTAEMRFLLGHEIGHIRRNHLLRRLLLAPALFLPLIGAAYSRSCESTCDRFGAFASEDLPASARAMLTLAGGKEAGKNFDSTRFAAQNIDHRGFFVSWYELISGYPSLSRRVKDLFDIDAGRPSPSGERNPIAYLFALCCFGGGFGGRGSLVITLFVLYMVVVFGALGIPAVTSAIKKAEARQAAQLNGEVQEYEEAAEEEFQPGTPSSTP